MVAIEEIADETASPSQERFLDADDIEKVLSQLTRPTARMQVEALIKKIRKEASALKTLESTSSSSSSSSSPPSSSPPPPTASPTPEPKKPAPAPTPLPVTKPPPPMASASATYRSIDRFAFDAGTTSDKFITLYVPLPGVGSVTDKKEQIRCVFGRDSFDVTVNDLDGKDYRLTRDSLEHDIVPEKSKHIVKADKIVVKLHKVKGEYGGFEYWSKLTDPKKKDKTKKKSGDPTAGLMDMMKDMYDSGDDNMRKIIGETMLKQRNGELNKDTPGGGLGDLGDF
mmetsp:Transcript_3020/g.8282  ORF Transcript_3020/g.8282 Transcript_3020/m.8282 type:complete len:283 (+) Transcript_3020:210-1058(+)